MFNAITESFILATNMAYVNGYREEEILHASFFDGLVGGSLLYIIPDNVSLGVNLALSLLGNLSELILVINDVLSSRKLPRIQFPTEPRELENTGLHQSQVVPS